MKIVIINQHPKDHLGGSEIQCHIIAKQLTCLNHEVIYLAVNGSFNYDVSYSVKPVIPRGSSIAHACIKENPDVVYWRFDKNCFRSAVKKIRMSGFPFVFAISHINNTLKWKRIISSTERNQLLDILSNFRDSFLSYWNHKGFNWVDGVTVLNKNYMNLLPVNRQIYIPNSMETNHKPFSWTKPYVVWIANIKAEKRPEICVELANAIEHLSVDVIMVGKIQSRKYLWLNNYKLLPNNLHYLGPKTIEEVNGILMKSICLVHTCQPEGFGNNFIQAWLCGKPVVSYEFDPEGIIKSKRIGFVSSANIKLFCEDVMRLINNKSLLNKYGILAKEYAQNKFNPENNVRLLETFLLEIIQQRNH